MYNQQNKSYNDAFDRMYDSMFNNTPSTSDSGRPKRVKLLRTPSDKLIAILEYSNGETEYWSNEGVISKEKYKALTLLKDVRDADSTANLTKI